MTYPAGLFFTPITQFLDVNGLPLAGGKLYSYVAGSSTPLPTYNDGDLAPAHERSNPIILDAYGRTGPTFLSPVAYKFDLYSSADVQQPGWPVDNVTSPGIPTIPNVPAETVTTLATKTTDTATSGTGETTLWAQTIPGGTLAATGDTLWIEYGGTLSGGDITTGQSETLRLKFAGTTIETCRWLYAEGAFIDCAGGLFVTRVNATTVRLSGGVRHQSPSFISRNRTSGLTAAATLASVVVGAANTTYRVSANIQVTTSTTHSFYLVVNYTDEAGAARQAVFSCFDPIGTTQQAITAAIGLGPYIVSPFVIHAKAGTTVSVQTVTDTSWTFGGNFTAVTYTGEGLIEELAPEGDVRMLQLTSVTLANDQVFQITGQVANSAGSVVLQRGTIRKVAA